jgi:hypothetical protein
MLSTYQYTCTIIIKNVRHTNLFVREGFYLIEFDRLVFNANSSSIGFYLHDLLGIQIILNNILNSLSYTNNINMPTFNTEL